MWFPMFLALFLAAKASGQGVFGPSKPTWYPIQTYEVSLLDGEWSFGFSDGDAMGPPGKVNGTVTVPSTVDAAPPGIPGARGLAIYERDLPETTNATAVEFFGCAFYCRVFVDDELVGENFGGGYAPWYLPLPSEGKKLTVMADNRFNATTAPLHTGGDFWHYGGLLRSVLWHSWAEPAVKRCLFFPFLEEDEWHVTLKITLTDPYYEGTLPVTLTWSQEETTRIDVDFSPGIGTTEMTVPPSGMPWDLENPHLTVVKVETQGGGVVERFGLREWKNQGNRLSLNGRLVKLKGWNHHTQFPTSGMSPSEAELDQDLSLLLRAGTSYVRGAHYPQDQRWLDRLDEVGVAMWEEALGSAEIKFIFRYSAT